jgi:N-acetylmuramoyl-L-alanine amidase
VTISLPAPPDTAAIAAFTDHLYAALVAYREARGESLDARAGVIFTLIERASHPCWWGSSIAECATHRWQYSSMTDPSDPQVSRTWPTSDPAWIETWELARCCLAGQIPNPVPEATHYHDIGMSVPPYWSMTGKFIGQIGRLKFYKVT